VIQLIRQTGLVIILLAHTLGTCDFFLLRVLPLIAYRPRRDRPKSSRERKFRFFFYFFFTSETPEKGYVDRFGLIFDWYFRRTPATLASALVVSTPETTRGLYTLPSRSRRLSPKTTSTTARGVIVAWQKNRNSTYRLVDPDC